MRCCGGAGVRDRSGAAGMLSPARPAARGLHIAGRGRRGRVPAAAGFCDHCVCLLRLHAGRTPAGAGSDIRPGRSLPSLRADPRGRGVSNACDQPVFFNLGGSPRSRGMLSVHDDVHDCVRLRLGRGCRGPPVFPPAGPPSLRGVSPAQERLSAWDRRSPDVCDDEGVSLPVLVEEDLQPRAGAAVGEAALHHHAGGLSPGPGNAGAWGACPWWSRSPRLSTSSWAG